MDAWRDALLAELVRLEVRGAIIFADDPSATALACNIGLPALLDLGVTNVMRLGDVPKRWPKPQPEEPAPEPLVLWQTDERPNDAQLEDDDDDDELLSFFSVTGAAPDHAVILCSTFLHET